MCKFVKIFDVMFVLYTSYFSIRKQQIERNYKFMYIYSTAKIEFRIFVVKIECIHSCENML